MDEDYYRSLAVEEWADFDVQIDQDAKVALTEDGSGAWVQAWVFVSKVDK